MHVMGRKIRGIFARSRICRQAAEHICFLVNVVLMRVLQIMPAW